MSKLNHAWVSASLEQADNERSKITEREKELYGASSIRQRCLINNLCAAGKINYLEVGVSRGATIIPAVMGNDCKAVGIEHFRYDDRDPDKWAPEGHIHYNMESQLTANIQRYDLHPETKIPGSITIEKGAFEEVDYSKFPKFDLCHFDVSPVNQKVYDDFFESVLPALTQECVVVFSAQSNGQHAEELNKSLIRHADKFEIQYSELRVSGGLSDASRYYSGVRIIGFKKKAVAAKKAAPVKPTAAKAAPKATATKR